MREWVIGMIGTVGMMGVVGMGATTQPLRPSSPPSPYTLSRTHDSLYHLNDFALPYPVYRFCTADVDGDGKTDALVGVVKGTRYDPVPARRLFVFKLVNGHVRPMWLGTRLGGVLHDFHCGDDGTVIALESTADNRLYSVSAYRWAGFGFRHERFLVRDADHSTATTFFERPRKETPYLETK